MPSPPGRLSVLVVDDCRDTANSTAMLLQLFGHTAEVAYGGTDALERVARTVFDVVLLDLMMPPPDGCEVARRLSARPGRPFLIAVTGCPIGPARLQAREAGFDLALAKPVEPAVLVGALDRIGRFLEAAAARHREGFDVRDSRSPASG